MLPPGFVSLQTSFRRESPQKRSVAVLPLKNETSEAANDFLSDGLSENLIFRLSYLPEIKVISRAAAFKYKGRKIAPDEAAREVNAATVLAGKLSKNNERIRVFLELINAADNSLIWSSQYVGKETELVFLQNKMASDVAAKLKIAETGEPQQIASRGSTESSAALENYLKGEFERQKMTAEGNRKSIEFYRRALESDDNFALAQQGLALAYRLAPAYRTVAAHEAYPLAKEAAMRALAIDPNLGSAHIPPASIKFAYDWDFTGAEREYQQAIRLAPNNPEARSSYSTFLVATGRTEQALSELKIAEQFDPQSPVHAANAGGLCTSPDDSTKPKCKLNNRSPANRISPAPLSRSAKSTRKPESRAKQLKRSKKPSDSRPAITRLNLQQREFTPLREARRKRAKSPESSNRKPRKTNFQRFCWQTFTRI